ncbi:efflux RND transporter permease subunit [Patescibacteria group bacterium]|nr:efflux RND transporter permease subunit [Patescibacteria group bacterium]
MRALFTIPKEASPSVNVPFYSVLTIYPGADPKTVDEQVTDKLEKKLKTISLVKKITSSSSYNISSITIEFYTNKKDVDAVNDIKAAIDQTMGSLPSDVRTPTSRKVDITGLPIYQFAIAGPYPSDILYEKAKMLEDEIKTVPGVADVTVAGNPTKEIKVNFHLDTIQSMDMDLGMIVAQLRGAFVKIPADKKQVDGNLYTFEINTYSSSLTGLIDQIRNFDLINSTQKTVKVSDIADVYLGAKENPKKTFILLSGDTVNAIGFSASRTPGFDIQTVTLALKEKVEAFKVANPELTTIEIQSSEEIIEKTYNLFLENFWETGLFVFVVIVIFLGRSSSLIVLISFLVVYLINFVVLKSLGYTFNNIVSFSLILVLGIMVDNLIVMTQGIAIGRREHK